MNGDKIDLLQRTTMIYVSTDIAQCHALKIKEKNYIQIELETTTKSNSSNAQQNTNTKRTNTMNTINKKMLNNVLRSREREKE